MNSNRRNRKHVSLRLVRRGSKEKNSLAVTIKLSFFSLYFLQTKLLMQGKLIAVAYTLRTYWNQFSLGGLCKQEYMHQCSFSIRGDKNHLILIIDNNSHNSFLWPEYFRDYFCENGFHIRLWHLSGVYFSAQRQHTAVQKCVHLWNNFPSISTLLQARNFTFLKYSIFNWKHILVKKGSAPVSLPRKS